MDLTLDYNIELFPLKTGQTFTLSLATSLSRGSAPGKEGEGEDKEQQWRPDGKGQKGIEEDYEYVMFGRVRATRDLEVLHPTHQRFENRYTSLTQERRFRTSRLPLRPNLRCSKLTLFPYRTAYASFGGLLMSLTGSFRHMTNVVLGESVYVLLRR